MACVVVTVQVVKYSPIRLHAILTLKPWRTMALARWRMNVASVEVPVPFLNAAVSTFCLERVIARGM